MESINRDTVIHGNQTNNFNGTPAKVLNPTRDDPCVSPVSLSPLDTYIDRPTISAEIASKMQKSCGSKSLVHTLALVGLGGTGKTQLVLRCIEHHRKRYDTILYLDVRNKTTTTSSIERCCDALSIAFERQSTDGLLRDAPAVQKLLKWLAAREQGQKWLVVLDNADELDHLPQIIPQNALAGSVIVTSQDGAAAKLLPRSKCTRIDNMEIEESTTLLAKGLNLDFSKPSLEVTSRLEKLANRLGGIALALDLAAARIRDDVDPNLDVDDIVSEGAAMDAIDQYLADLEGHEKSMLSDPEHNSANAYQKTIWSVWETVLSSVERSEQRNPEDCGYTMHLLKLAVVLGPTVVHHEIFRAASQSLETVCTGFAVDIPLWFKSFLQVSSPGVWDSFAYRRCIARLERFHLVHPALRVVCSVERTHLDTNPNSVPWLGFTIHSLVRRCTGVDETHDEYKICGTALVMACCRTWVGYTGNIHFGKALYDYILHVGFAFHHMKENGMADLCTLFGTTLSRFGQHRRAECFLDMARTLKSNCFGTNAPETRDVDLELYRIYLMLSLRRHRVPEEVLRESEGYRDKANRIMKQISDQEEGKLRLIAAGWDAEMISFRLWDWLVILIDECLKRTKRDARIYYREIEMYQARYEDLADTISRQLQALDIAAQALGRHDFVVGALRSGLVEIYMTFEKFDLAKGQLEDLLAQEQHNFGKLDHRTLQSMERLAFCQVNLQAYDAAKWMMQEAYQLSHTALGSNDPRTRLRERHLERLTNRQSMTTLTESETRDTNGEECVMTVEKHFGKSYLNKWRERTWRESD